jgi:hypothetical protein
MAFMLLFYSVECGMKSVLMRRQGLRDTSQIDERLRRSHDLRDLAKELNLPAAVQRALRPYGRKHGSGIVAVRDLHAAWRYGAALEANEEVLAVRALRDLSEWCRSILGG